MRDVTKEEWSERYNVAGFEDAIKGAQEPGMWVVSRN